ncbi:MAG TPA: hypothetical protein VE444_03355 [Gaiellaceae bacterium]|jgi:hypothetical protein|nr:hypothetical protein [Gaiellaceae bacterium]
MPNGSPRMVFLGFGKYVRADKIYALEPLRGGERGGGRRTRVWVEGIPEPIVASRTERTILVDMGMEHEGVAPVVSDAIALAERIVSDSESGRFDVGEYTRRARRLLEATATAKPPEPDQLF